MIVRTLLVGAGFCLGAVAPACALAADLVFAQNFLTGTKQIVTFPVGDPTNMAVIGPQTDTFTGIDFDPAAKVLWAINFATHTLGTVNQATGAYAQATVLTDSSTSAFTIDPVGGAFYISKGDRYIYSLDPVSGEATLLGTGAPAGTGIHALAADCSGRLFAFASNGTDPDALYQSHPGVSDATLIGSPGYSGATTLEFDNHTGILYAWFYASGGGNTASTHGTIDATTAQVSQISSVEGRYRMAVRNECSIFADDFEA